VPTLIAPGAIIDGKYRVVRRIGEGGMGTVYEGENVRIERRVAIKVLHDHVASSPEFAERFEREARASARVGSEHVCDVLDLGDLPNGERYLVMEFLEGESLEERLERGTMTAAELAPIAFQLLEGLGTMHHASVIHRDLKPANIFLARVPRKGTDVVKILDFGVAKIVPRADQPNAMTSTGMMMGTPLYMSPEQARGARDVDGRTDLYAASVIFYRALTGDVPHIGANLHELLFKIVLEDPRPIRELVPSVDEVFAGIVTKGLARDADQRFLSARDYQEAIMAWGRAQGDPNLVFSLTLPERTPSLRSLASGYPAELLAARGAFAPTTPSGRIGPPTPQGPSPEAAPATPTGQRGSGTPMGWAEMTPGGSYRAIVAAAPTLDSRQLAGGGTQVIDSRAGGRAGEGTRPTVPSAPPEAPAKAATNKTGGAAIAAAAVGVIAVVAVGVHFLANKSAPTSASVSTSAPSVVVVPEPTAKPSAEPAPIPTVEAKALDTASAPATPSASAAPPRPTPKAAATSVASPSTATKPSVAAATASATASPPQPVPTASTGHRKFRTDL
jgi:serine/threonine-protein kinase